jgi:uncharacterized membrane protein YqjE
VNAGIDALVVDYDNSQAQQRVLRLRRMLRSRLASLGISIVILIAIFIWQRDRFLDNPLPMILVYAVVLLGGIGWVVGVLIAYRAARRAVATDQHGVALRVDRRGVELAGQQIPWSGLGSLDTAKGRWPQGPTLRATTTDGRSVEVPLEQLPVLPATVDSAARAYSGGRFGLDLSALDA